MNTSEAVGGASFGPPGRVPAADGQRRRVLIISNPVAGRRRSLRLRRVAAHLAGLGAEVTLRQTARRGDAEAFAAEVLPGSTDVIAVAGGDGTINEVLNGLEPPSPPIAIIPLGTANVLAIEVGLSLRPREIAAAIACGQASPIRLGTANGRRFVMMLGIGFDAEVVRRVGPRLKRVAGRGGYVAQSLLAAFSFPRRRYTVRIDGADYDAASLVIANGRSYAGRYTCAPQARLDQPSLEVCLFREGGSAAALTYMAALAAGRLHRLRSVEIVRASRVQVDGPPGEPVQADGDIALSLPLDVAVDPLPVALIGGSGRA